MRLAILLLLLLPTVAPAAAKVKAKATVYAPYDPVVLTASGVTSADAQYLWDVDGAAQTVEAGGTLYVWAPPGSYRVVLTAFYLENGKIKVERDRYSFTVSGTPPQPPQPPQPADPLTAALQAAYNLDLDADRVKSLQYLQGVYQGMAAQAPSRTEATNTAWMAWERSVVQQSVTNPSGLTAGQLKNLRTAISNDTKAAWGANQAPVTAGQAQAQLTRISNALQGVK